LKPMGPINSPKRALLLAISGRHLVWGNGDVARHAAPRPTRVAQNHKLCGEQSQDRRQARMLVAGRDPLPFFWVAGRPLVTPPNGAPLGRSSFSSRTLDYLDESGRGLVCSYVCSASGSHSGTGCGSALGHLDKDSVAARLDIQAASEGNLSGDNAQRHDQLPYSQGRGADRFGYGNRSF
jgi:hypothetical protein